MVSASATFCVPAHLMSFTDPSRKKCTRTSTCRERSRFVGFSLIRIQDALSSQISVGPVNRELFKGRRSLEPVGSRTDTVERGNVGNLVGWSCIENPEEFMSRGS